MINNMFERSISLIGEEKFQKLSSTQIAIFGLGGVGGTVAESLLRSGAQNLLLVDFDVVNVSNLNRQILFNNQDIGKQKTIAARAHLLAINPHAKIEIINEKICGDFFKKNQQLNIQYIIDAIDDVEGKIAIAKYATKNKIPLIISLGMANRLDSTLVEVIRLDKTTNDPLAKKIRYEYKKAGLDTKSYLTVCSKEIPIKDGVNLNSIMTVPSSAGLAITSYIIKNL